MTTTAHPKPTPTLHNGERRKRLWPYLIPIAVIFVASLGTVYFPFVNQPTLWFGLPAIAVWIALWVLAIPGALAFVEHAGGYGRVDDARDFTSQHPITVSDQETTVSEVER